ncbi:class I SAM-dependent methyltransferase [Streptomyces sp. SID13031]|uniref:class I SAM-dependent methyltransferase n=1 Tax=Streptomyces sp. SID13031 TaxID=2706046 RepID=UPI0013C79A21|nr:class I SAM-dependent methyltransferase [Streptomyces sp. SID13031]NEA36900.1 class I SAM-dependent methyltransferase [Streptomyces sp. SID13031]
MDLDLDRVETAFRTDRCMPWSDRSERLSSTLSRCLLRLYRTELVACWIPAVDGLAKRLANGARVADIGCGLGEPLLLVAQAFPATQAVGIDSHQKSLDEAASRAGNLGLSSQTEFRREDAAAFAGGPYDVVFFFNALHDLPNPSAALARAHHQLAEDGIVFIVEPMAKEHVTLAVGDPVSRIAYGSSSMLCTPGAAQRPNSAMGNQVPTSTWHRLLDAAGFQNFQLTATTAFSRVMVAQR